MKLRNTFSGVMLVLMAALFGAILIWLPGWVIDKYDRISQLGAVWGWLYLAAVIAGASLLVGSICWTVWRLYGSSLKKRLARARRSRNPSELSVGQQSAEIEENIGQIQQWKEAAGTPGPWQEELDPLLREFEAKRESLTLELVAFGTISSGKSSVLNLLAGREVFATDVRGGTTVNRNQIPWPGVDRVFLVDTPGIGEIDGEEHVEIAANAARDADMVLFVVDGPLRDNEFRLLQRLGQMEKRILVCLNKSDWYLEEDREKLLGQLRHQTRGIVLPEEIVGVQAQAGSRPRQRIRVDGSVELEQVPVPPDISLLAQQMMEVVRRDGKELLMANLLLQSRGMLEKARDRVQQAIDDRAWQLVDRYMWGAAGLAAANPFPLIDLVAGVGISTKMIMDLADVYQQKVDLQTARKWLGQMGKILVSVLGSQGATVAVGAVAASLIKAFPFVGTLAGHALQGAIQALITRWIGAVFIEYFRSEMQMTEGGLASLARRQWEQLTTRDELRKLVQTAREKLAGNEG